MTTRHFAKSTLVVGFGASVTLAGALVFAGHETTVESYTGCLSLAGGTFVSVAPGNAPRSPCGPGQIQVHLSGGDITSVVAGAGLQGGSTNGVATLSVGSSYGLPQTCSIGSVAKWNGSAWVCATDADTDPTAYGGFSAVFPNGAGFGLPDSETSIGRLFLPAGKYAIFAKVNVFIELSSERTFSVHCHLNAESDVDTAQIHSFESDDYPAHVISLNLLHEFVTDSFTEVACDDGQGDNPDDNSEAKWGNLRITAIRLGAFQNLPLQ
jgi:hypothetical protein